ncbi:MAG TPA: 3-hydroxyacyl-CoA dehydrogenase family protein, partial [Thioalkalivibrio sp.]|nr:3-hydroxyacyl-CoA dehydrogenase family protein [Thioalkalivibrio sp.]
GEDVPASWLDKLAENGRLGQKTGAGVYRYEEGSRKPLPDPEVDQLITDFRREQGITPRTIRYQEILERCMYVMINEGARILEEGIADSPADIDTVWVYGYGFPKDRGGPMTWADSIGLKTVLATIARVYENHGGEQWKPAGLLQKLVANDQGFSNVR